MECAVVLYDGVLIDEFEAFWSVLRQLDKLELLAVGAEARRYVGPGGSVVADLAFDDVPRADIVVVPGGLGCERAATDPAIVGFLDRVGSGARYVAASSTGSVILAAAGLLHGEPAATHWLASELLGRFGSALDARRLATRGNVITCTGAVTALEAALLIVERLEGPQAVVRVRTSLVELGQAHLKAPGRWRRLARRLLSLDEPDPPAATAFSTADKPPVTPLVVMIDLVEDEREVERLRKLARRRQRRRD